MPLQPHASSVSMVKQGAVWQEAVWQKVVWHQVVR